MVLADDQGLVRAGFRVAGRVDAATWRWSARPATGPSAVELARSDRPDVVLMDIRMPRMDGLEATRRIVADDLLAGVRVLVLTTFDLDEYVYEALRGRGQRLPAQGHPPGRAAAPPSGWSPPARPCWRRASPAG